MPCVCEYKRERARAALRVQLPSGWRLYWIVPLIVPDPRCAGGYNLTVFRIPMVGLGSARLSGRRGVFGARSTQFRRCKQKRFQYNEIIDLLVAFEALKE